MDFLRALDTSELSDDGEEENESASKVLPAETQGTARLKPEGALSRADLLRLLVHAEDGSALEDRYAKLVGFERQSVKLPPRSATPVPTDTSENAKDPLPVTIARRPMSPVSLFVPCSYRATQQVEDPEPLYKSSMVKPGQKLAPGRPVRCPELMSWSQLERHLQAFVSVDRSGPEIDLKRAIDAIARTELLSPLPRLDRPRLPDRLLVVRDLSEHLIPFWREQEVVRDAIRYRFPEIEVQDIVFHEAEHCFYLCGEDTWDEIEIAESYDSLLVLSDLGALSKQADLLGEIWRKVAHDHRGPLRSVLSPLAASAMPTGLAERWQIVEWADRPTNPRRSIAERRRMAERLLDMIALPVSVEPGLLRLIRVLAMPEADAAVESLAWTAFRDENRSSGALIRTGRIAPRQLSAFAALEPDLAKTLIQAMREWHGELAAEVWFTALLDLPEHFREFDDHGDLQRMDDYFARLANQIRRSGPSVLTPGLKNWLTRLGGLIDPAHKDKRVVSAIAAADKTFVPAHRPGALEIPEDQHLRGMITIHQHGANLVCSGAPGAKGSLIGALWSKDGLIEIEPRDPFQQIWGDAGPPDWVADQGFDAFGPWVSVNVEAIDLRLRWIPPGQFVMGSDAEEAGYKALVSEYESLKGIEEPQTEIIFAEGFWLMDAPVTQALWDAVMGPKADSDHPNRFPDPERPVEMVSWNDAQEFMERLNGQVPGLDLRLPSESEWEYACRAGTEAATYAGPMDIVGERNAPILDEIAWYAGNSGVDFDLADGHDSSDWAEKQYPHERAGTRKVKQKQPNAWGCYDMLGNVWEWCADAWSNTHEGADPTGAPRPVSQQDGGRFRVARGGGWLSNAQDVRSACRLRFDPDFRYYDYIGFRCARGQVSSGRRSGGVGAGREAEPRPEQMAPRPDREGFSTLETGQPEKVYISCRRGADSLFAGRLRDRLETKYGAERIIGEADHAPMFHRDFLDMQLEQCKVFFVVIGPGWLEASDRLQDPDDFVRMELLAALEHSEISIRPILVDDVPMPKADALPEPLRPLLRRSAVRIPNENFTETFDALLSVTPLDDFTQGSAASSEVLDATPHTSDSARSKCEHGRVLAGAAPVRLKLPKTGFIIRTDSAELDVTHWTRGHLPWAESFGRDRFGVWSSFRVQQSDTRLRWIPPGRFRMGSPKDEPGRFWDESPLTDVTHAEGFWLMDAPVTQALWDAVMGPKADSDHPNQFPDPERPVEMVSWHDAQDFLERLNGQIPGLDLRLPSESEWEYACRAGTETATYAGPMDIVGKRNAPILDEIAWYGGNSGVDFDLADGYDSSGWVEKQYPHERAGTRKVKQKQPNAWGCYDMLGNVWEWCAYESSDTNEDADPTGAPRPVSQEDGGRLLVLRGGGWNNFARNVRSACRDGDAPDGRHDFIGFRCARGQVSSGRRSGVVGAGREAEPRPEQTAPRPGVSAVPDSPEQDTFFTRLTDRFFGPRKRKDDMER